MLVLLPDKVMAGVCVLLGQILAPAAGHALHTRHPNIGKQAALLLSASPVGFIVLIVEVFLHKAVTQSQSLHPDEMRADCARERVRARGAYCA